MSALVVMSEFVVIELLLRFPISFHCNKFDCELRTELSGPGFNSNWDKLLFEVISCPAVVKLIKGLLDDSPIIENDI